MTKRNYKRTPSKYERGQAIILVALAVVGVVAIVGLMMDGGILLLEYDRLKRAVDAGAISASLQFREGYTINELKDEATQFLILNQVKIDQVTIEVKTCDSIKLEASPDPDLLAELCTTPPRKLAYIKATEEVPFSFMRVLGFTNARITTDSIGEAASVDLVLVLDTSQSMAAEGGGSPSQNDVPEDDPSQCNPTNTCHPLKEIKDAAIALVQQLFFPYDRVAIVTFDRVPHALMTLSATDGMTAAQAENTIITGIGGLTVFQPPACPQGPDQTHCRYYDETTGIFTTFNFPMWMSIPGNPDRSSLPSSNIGGGLAVAGEQFAAARENSLWVVIALAGGPANTGCTHTTSSYRTDCDGKDVTAQGRICPDTTWDFSGPLCRDALAQSRHASGNAAYDADDYARDMADWVSDPASVGAVIFTIGLGDLNVANPKLETDAAGLTQNCAGSAYYNVPGAAGERLLCYIAEQAGGASANHGTYNFAPDAAGLTQIFVEIAGNIAIRLSQ